MVWIRTQPWRAVMLSWIEPYLEPNVSQKWLSLAGPNHSRHLPEPPKYSHTTLWSEPESASKTLLGPSLEEH